MKRMIRTGAGRLLRVRPVRVYPVLQSYVIQSPFPSYADMAPPRTGDESNASSKPASANTEEPPPQSQPQPIPNGQAYRVTSPSEVSLVTPQLSQTVSQILEQFARANGFNAKRPLEVAFGRGTLGLHRFQRAVDIYAVGDKGIGEWAQTWNAAMRQANNAPNPQERAGIVTGEKARNLGYKLYIALQRSGGWAQPQGYPVQLFGPWTRSEGPHKAISDRLLQAHRDHIHVAK